MPAPTMSFDEENQQQEILPPAPISQDLEVRVFGSLVTAQRVAVARNEKAIVQKLREAAAVYGDNYYYEWETKNRDGTRGLVTGITIKGAMTVVRLFGNCAVDVRAVPFNETHDMFYARFADLETGFSTVRAFKQRKNQNIGMKDKERGEDIIFQIGQSKAIRNVINNALQDFCGEVVEKSRNALIEKMEGDGKFADKVAGALKGLMEKHAITDKMAEAYIGRPLPEWVNRHIAKMYVAMKSIDNGDATVNDVFASEAVTIKPTETDKKPAAEGGGKEGNGNSGQPAADSGTGGKRQPAKRNAAKAGVDNSDGKPAEQQQAAQQGQAPVQDTAAKASAPAAEQSQAGQSQPAEQASAPDGANQTKPIAQEGGGDNLSPPSTQKSEPKQPPAPPVGEDEDWFTSEA